MTHRAPRQDEAASSVIALAIAGILFLAAVGLMMVLARGSIPPAQASDGDPAGRLQAEAALALLLTEGTSSGGGAGWLDPAAGAQQWTPGTAPQVPGLLERNERHLDTAKLENMLGLHPPPGPVPEKRLDPDELRAGLGFAPGTLVHVRVTPLLAPLEDGSPGLPLMVHYVRGADPDVADLEEDLLAGLLEAPSDLDTVSAGILSLDVDPVAGDCGPATPDVLVYGTGHADAAPADDPADIAFAVQGCGLTLLLLGSPTPCSACLAALVAPAPPASSCAPLVSRDAAHPVASSPNALGAGSYVAHGPMPALGAAADAFEAAAGLLPEPTLAASLCGSFGTGQVLLARVSPTSLYGPGSASASEGARLLHNLLVRHEQAMSFDYGATLPEGPQAAPASAVVAGPVTWGGGRVPVRITLWIR